MKTITAGYIRKAVATAPRRAASYTKLAPPAPAQPVAGAARRYWINISSDALDHDNDRVLRGAVDPASTAPVPLLVAHDYESRPVGTVSQFSYTDAGRLRAQAAFPAPGVSARADEVVGLIEGGVPVQYSLGFKDLEKERNAEGGFNFSKIRLMEVSVVPVGASPGTGTLAAVKMALGAKGAAVNDGQDPMRDALAVRTCPYIGSGCPKRVGQTCSLAGACRLHLGSSGSGGGIGGGLKHHPAPLESIRTNQASDSIASRSMRPPSPICSCRGIRSLAGDSSARQ